MPTISHTADSIIDHNLGLQRNNHVLHLVFKSPNVGEAFADLNAAHLTGLALSPKLRELLILQTAWRTQSEYAWTTHQDIAKSVGVTDAQIASIQQGQLQSFAFNEKEKTLLHFAVCIGASSTLSNDDFAAFRQYFSDRELVEIVVVCGFYDTLAMLASVFALESDHRYSITSATSLGCET
jgi:alkylhydroperoxidase family enzyme